MSTPADRGQHVGQRGSGRRLPRIAFAIPTLELGAYWKPVLQAMHPATSLLRVFTAMPWRDVTPADRWPDGPLTQVGRKTRVTTSGDPASDYGGGVMVLSPAIAAHLVAARPDVVVVSGFSLWTVIVIGLRPLMRWRVLLLWEGSSPRVDHRSSARRTRLRRWLGLLADAVMTNSPGGRDYLLDHLGMPRDAVWQAPYMVPAFDVRRGATHPRPDDASDSTTPSPGGPRGASTGRVRILSVGRLEARKGNAALLDAVAALPPDVRDRVDVRLVGDGPESARLRAQARDLGLADRVTFAGWVPYERLGAELVAADLLVFLTHEDTWGMVALEAMAVGTPVLCSNLAGACALVADDLVVDPHDIVGVTAALRRLLQAPEALPRHGRAARERMAGHRPRDAAARLLAGARWAATGISP